MSSKKDLNLIKFLENSSLENYYEAFQKLGITHADLKFLKNEDLVEVIPKRFHRERFLEIVASRAQKMDGESCEKNEATEADKESEKGKEEVCVQMRVKFRNEVKKVYDVALGTNEDLIGKLLQMFLECELKLPDKTVLTKERKFTLEKWLEKNGEGIENEIRGVLSVEGPSLGNDNSEAMKMVKELEEKLKEAERERDDVETKSKKIVKKLKSEKRELEKKMKKLEKEVTKLKKRVAKTGSTNQKPTVLHQPAPPGFKTIRGMLVPQNVRFVENEHFRSQCRKVFSNGNTKATAVEKYERVIFKASAVFTTGKRYYFQVTVDVVDGRSMGLGLLNGDVASTWVGGHKKGWEYNCFSGGRALYHSSKKTSSNYGPIRVSGRGWKHTIGMYCDFRNGKGEVSFVVDGKNWGVAFKNVLPPVSPAFYFYVTGDSFKIEAISDVPVSI